MVYVRKRTLRKTKIPYALVITANICDYLDDINDNVNQCDGRNIFCCEAAEMNSGHFAEFVYVNYKALSQESFQIL